ncbi:MAG: exodeoxyribonuclease VII small subunit [Sciscionella sp.]
MTEEPDELSYEQARDELVAVVAKLEAGAATLQESMQLWERGEQLAATCQRWLDGARERMNQVIAKSAAGGTATAAADPPSA